MEGAREMKKFFRPLKGCRILATEEHHTLKPMDYVGRVHSVDGNIITFKDRSGQLDTMIWRFKEGNNKTVVFGA
jgi:hypothetical protein